LRLYAVFGTEMGVGMVQYTGWKRLLVTYCLTWYASTNVIHEAFF
jgi:hypothetical protein